MGFIGQSRRYEIIILCAIFVLLIWNLIYFQKIEFQLDAANHSSTISIGTSDRNESNDISWPSLPPKLYEVSKRVDKPVFGPETFGESIKQKQTDGIRRKRNEEHYSIGDDPDGSATERFFPAKETFFFKPPHPLKPPKTYDLNEFIPESKEPSKKTIITHWDLCPETPSNLVGEIQVDTNEETLDDVQAKMENLQVKNGFHTPDKCKARTRVAIIVPYRNREKELAIFLKNIHPFLMKQQLDYGVFVVEQTVGTKFNRAMLLNIGYLEAKKIKEFDCFIFHDVDLLPLNDRNFYTCSKDNPRHLAVAVDKFNNSFPSNGSGVLAVTSQQFEKVNGYSNRFWGWGWGSEDLDFSNRVTNAGYKIERPDAKIARYTMNNKYDPEEPNNKRFDFLKAAPKHFKTNGLNSVKYSVECIDECPAYKWILVTLQDEVPGEGSNVEYLGVK